jgi:16S rRNA (guanine966-N2)-methyltransferase
MLRIIAGSLRGRKLAAPPGFQTRPITDRVKETLFNILGSRLARPGALPPWDVLDLFAGTGSLGIEAISRGARSCVFVEWNRKALRALHENTTRLGISDVCRIAAENAWKMQVAPPDGGSYGLIFVDPPYEAVSSMLMVVDLLERLSPQLSSDGIIVFRHAARTSFPVYALRSLRCIDERRIGKMRLWFFAHAQDAGGRTATDEGSQAG